MLTPPMIFPFPPTSSTFTRGELKIGRSLEGEPMGYDVYNIIYYILVRHNGP